MAVLPVPGCPAISMARPAIFPSYKYIIIVNCGIFINMFSFEDKQNTMVMTVTRL